MMDHIEEFLRSLPAGRVLDVATGNGGFIHFLVDHLGSFDEIIGIDSNDKSAAAFPKEFSGLAVRFLKMDASRLEFDGETFDTVCISNSLHHMADLDSVLKEMLRVLKPGGVFIVNEMYRDDQTEAQMSHVLLHHWWAAVDRAKGVFHGETYTRQELLNFISRLGLGEIATQDMKDLGDDPKDPETIQYLVETFERYKERLVGLPDEGQLSAKGEELRRRVEETGFHSATSLLYIGKKGAG